MARNKELANGEVKTRLTNGWSNTETSEYETKGRPNGQGQCHKQKVEGQRCWRTNCLKKLSNGVVAGLENSFYRFVKSSFSRLD